MRFRDHIVEWFADYQPDQRAALTASLRGGERPLKTTDNFFDQGKGSPDIALPPFESIT